MRIIKMVPASDNNPGTDFLTREVIKVPLNKQQGVTIDEMRIGIKILDKLDEANGDLKLSDDEYKHLRAKVEAFPWGMVDRTLLQYVDSVLDAPEVGT